MSDSTSDGRMRWIAIVVVFALLAPAAIARAYVKGDARIAGKDMYAFASGGENVTVVLGEFRLTIGQRVISGRDGVLWIRTSRSGSTLRHDIVAYVEGDARVDEPGGASTTDQRMLVTVRNEGRIRAAGILTERKLEDFPLYKRASAFRQSPRIQKRPAATVKSTSAPAAGAEPTVASKNPSTAPTATEAAPGPVTEIATLPAPPQPINFHADSLSSEIRDGRRVTIARGHVYMSRGDPDDKLFLELRSQAAVIFLEQDVPDREDTGSPYRISPAKIEQTGEVVTGAYLEGDVVIAHGERSFRGPSAFYDFTTDRAIVVNPVFRTVQEQRNIPVYIRAREARALSNRELWFADAKVSTSEFYTPSYHIGASRAYMMDTAPYDQEGRRLGEPAWHAKLKHTTFNVRGIPILYAPFTQGDLEQGNSALRKLEVGRHGSFGWGVESQWHLFRLLGLVKPQGFKGRLSLDGYERGGVAGVELEYTRTEYSGYHLFYGVYDQDAEDDFGTERDEIPAPNNRGRVLMRHKQVLPKDWELQFELSYICDRNFLEQYFPNEFYAGKEQETVLYVRKQKNNWSFSSLLKTRLNRFQEQTESYPDMGLYLLGEPLAGDRLTFFHESHAGVKRYLMSNAIMFNNQGRNHVRFPLDDFDSEYMVRLDTREEVTFPLHAGPVNFAPYVVGRATYWSDEWPESTNSVATMWRGTQDTKQCRPYGQVGVRANTHIWGTFDGVESRLWDVHRLKHIITPEVTGWVASSSGVYPRHLYPMDEGIEGLERTSGAAVNLYQRLQTKRGPAENRQTVDWMRLNLSLGVYDNDADNVISNGRFFSYRPENSLDRNHFNAEYFWQISDATMLLADAYYDTDDSQLGRGNIGIAVQRDPRLRYYAGLRYIDDVDSAVGTFGVSYKINRKYSISAFEQYDFAFDNGQNLSTSFTITRKLPRWYAAFTFSYDNTDDEVTMLISFWPQGISEVRLGGSKLSLLGGSDKN